MCVCERELSPERPWLVFTVVYCDNVRDYTMLTTPFGGKKKKTLQTYFQFFFFKDLANIFTPGGFAGIAWHK